MRPTCYRSSQLQHHNQTPTPLEGQQCGTNAVGVLPASVAGPIICTHKKRKFGTLVAKRLQKNAPSAFAKCQCAHGHEGRQRRFFNNRNKKEANCRFKHHYDPAKLETLANGLNEATLSRTDGGALLLYAWADNAGLPRSIPSLPHTIRCMCKRCKITVVCHHNRSRVLGCVCVLEPSFNV